MMNMPSILVNHYDNKNIICLKIDKIILVILMNIFKLFNRYKNWVAYNQNIYFVNDIKF